MNRVLFPIVFLAFLLAGCTTQRLHFSGYTDTNARLDAKAKPLLQDGVTLGSVSGGNYRYHGEFSAFSWHGYVDGRYEGFRPLPYGDPAAEVKTWLSEILAETKVTSGPTIMDVELLSMKMKVQKDNMFDYRACLVELELVFRNADREPVSRKVKGIGKIRGADIKVLSTNSKSMGVSISREEPAACKLAIVTALRDL